MINRSQTDPQGRITAALERFSETPAASDDNQARTDRATNRRQHRPPSYPLVPEARR
jgi:hypothetical protein